MDLWPGSMGTQSIEPPFEGYGVDIVLIIVGAGTPLKSLNNRRWNRNVWQRSGKHDGRGVRRGTSVTGAGEEGPARRRELQKEVELGDVRREDSKAELLGLQEQDESWSALNLASLA